ncbi:MAG: MerR family transcriptional regulator [Acidaminococcaceae bacterium]|nr:MerR family transcriptional regulator [Acidaminococcaceae bacterium]
MNNHPKDLSSPYFTAGELASMFGISKQSLLYYDKIHLLSPDFISENGYRHYSIAQYLDLEIIVNLRSLDIPISDIQHYLQNRGQDQLKEIFRKKDQSCQEIILENERIRKSLAVINGKLQEEIKELRNQVFIRSYPIRYIKVNPLTGKDSGKDRIVLFAKASHKNMHNRCLLEKQQGWIVDREDFFSGHCSNKSLGFFFFLTGPVHNHHFESPGEGQEAQHTESGLIRTETKQIRQKKIILSVLPESLYCEMTFDGTFYEKVNTISKIIQDQLEKYKLHPVGDVYVLPVQNHWFTKSHEQYVTKVFFQAVH